MTRRLGHLECLGYGLHHEFWRVQRSQGHEGSTVGELGSKLGGHLHRYARFPHTSRPGQGHQPDLLAQQKLSHQRALLLAVNEVTTPDRQWGGVNVVCQSVRLRETLGQQQCQIIDDPFAQFLRCREVLIGSVPIGADAVKQPLQARLTLGGRRFDVDEPWLACRKLVLIL